MSVWMRRRGSIVVMHSAGRRHLVVCIHRTLVPQDDDGVKGSLKQKLASQLLGDFWKYLLVEVCRKICKDGLKDEHRCR